MRQFSDLAFTHNADLDMIELHFAIQPNDVEKLHAALAAGKLQHGHYSEWDEEKNCWFCGYLRTNTEEFQIGADYETGKIRLAVDPTYDRLDGTAPADVSAEWMRFIAPLKQLAGILQ